MALKAHDPHQSIEWTSPDFEGVVCKIRPLTAREFAECQRGEQMVLFIFEVARRGLVSCEGVENEDGSPRPVKHQRTADRRGIVPAEWFDGLPSDFWVQLANAIIEHSGIGDDEAGNS